MEVTYDKAAIQEYMDAIGNVGLSFRRTKDESMAHYNSCVQQYSRIYSELEQASHNAYNKVEAAESMRRSADAEYETAMRIMENSDDEDERKTAQDRAQRARRLQIEADSELENASSALTACQAKMTKLTTLWEQYTPQLEAVKGRVEDGLSSFIALAEHGNRDLATFIGVMDKAQVALHGGTVSGSSSTVPNGTNNGAVPLESEGSKFANNSPVGQNTTQKGNSIGIIYSAGLASLVMSVAGSVQSFPYTKAGLAKAHRAAISSGDKEMIAKTESLYRSRVNAVSSARDDKWNKEYMPLVHANIRRSVELHFSDYVSEEKLNNCLSTLSFMDQDELAKRYGRGFQKGTLGFNDGESSNIAHDIKGVTYDGRVGDKAIPGSGNTNINYALVTAIHENLHMMSANDTPFELRRGIMVGGDETSRAMNEAFTEYFTFISCGGDTPLGGFYPGVYSGYQILMQEMPTIEKAVGRDCMMDAYFNNNPQRMRTSIDAILGAGAWDDMCAASYDVMYNNNANNAAARLSGYLNKLSAT